MHNIFMAEFVEEFAHCWSAAGSHIQRMAGEDPLILGLDQTSSTIARNWLGLL